MVTVKEVCDHFKVTPRTVYRWIKEGAPMVKLGFKHYAASIEVVAEWLEKR